MIIVNTDHYPLVLVNFDRGPYDEAVCAQFFAEMRRPIEQSMRLKSRHVVCTVGRDDPNAAERRIIARLMNEMPANEVACVGRSIVVVKSPFARGVLTAIRWLAPSMIPIVVVSTADQAADGAREALKTLGLIVAPGALELARDWLRAAEQSAPVRIPQPPSRAP